VGVGGVCLERGAALRAITGLELPRHTSHRDGKTLTLTLTLTLTPTPTATPTPTQARDPRLPVLLAFLAGWAAFWWRCAIANTAPRALMAVVGFGLVPYLLASNLLFPVGTCKVLLTTTYSLPPTTYHVTAYCSPLTTYDSLLTAHCSRLTTQGRVR
jgi:hypothetical protein